ncbi:MAG: glycoside hydrolase family 3 C-terminal domain-containing protein [Defluviitaleaceae bacterium]|nr:glycoside hydrolase family 3 C-terminal domain-containing protein [Defluviitaleaceae bacterium]
MEKKVRELMSKMTLDEKISFLPSRHPEIERLGLPAFWVGGEGAHGLVVREGGEATVFSQTFGLSMTWNKTLLRKIGDVIGNESRAYFKKRERKGLLTLFFPTIDMERDPRWGRNEEAYGEDPFLAGKLAVEIIKGAQGDHEYYLKTAATPKHFYANNYEYGRSTADSVISDERLKHEYYLKVFAYAFEEGNAASMMTAYNKMNGIPAMLHPEMNEIVRAKWGADSFFVSDGGAFKLLQSQHKTFETYAEGAAASIKAGLDCFLDDPVITIDAVTEALKRGLLTEADIDTAVFNQLKILFRLGVYGDRESNPYEKIDESILCSKESSQLARQTALEVVTLLENDGFLPLDKNTSKIAVIGPLGGENLPDWYSGNPPYEITPLDGIKSAFPNSEIVYSDACDIVALYNEAEKTWLCVGDDGAIFSDAKKHTKFRVYNWGYGIFGFQNIETKKFITTTLEGELRCDAEKFWGWFVRELFFLKDGKFLPEEPHGTKPQTGVASEYGKSVYNKPYSEDGVRKINDALSKLTVKILSDGTADAVEKARGADAVILTLGNHPLVGARECIDRENLDFPKNMTDLLEKVSDVNKNTVLFLIAGYPFDIEEQAKKVRAVLFTTHGAQELGTSVGLTLSGEYNPAGRLSMTWYKGSHKFPDLNDYDIIKNKMTYLYNEMPVLYEFGYGLSYTKFKYDDLSLEKTADGIAVKFSLTNTEKVAGDEVAQVYFSHIDAKIHRPIKQLAGFERIHLTPGETRQISILVPHKELMIYSPEKGEFVPVPGTYKFAVGASSLDIRLDSGVTLA